MTRIIAIFLGKDNRDNYDDDNDNYSFTGIIVIVISNYCNSVVNSNYNYLMTHPQFIILTEALNPLIYKLVL